MLDVEVADDDRFRDVVLIADGRAFVSSGWGSNAYLNTSSASFVIRGKQDAERVAAFLTGAGAETAVRCESTRGTGCRSR